MFILLVSGRMASCRLHRFSYFPAPDALWSSRSDFLPWYFCPSPIYPNSESFHRMWHKTYSCARFTRKTRRDIGPGSSRYESRQFGQISRGQAAGSHTPNSVRAPIKIGCVVQVARDVGRFPLFVGGEARVRHVTQLDL